MRTLIIVFLIAHSLVGQPNDDFHQKIVAADKYQDSNSINKYNAFDFSKIWTKTKEASVYGIIGKDHTRIRIKILSAGRDSFDLNKYIITGKSNVYGNVCDFTGTINIDTIKEVKTFHYGVDSLYADKGISAQGILIASYDFRENQEQVHSGLFQGILYSKWHLDSKNQIQYDDIESVADGYMNNAFVGTWKNYSNGNVKLCNWADFRVPNPNPDFDVGVGDFSPSKKYYDKGWKYYQNAWGQRDSTAIEYELREWWK